MQSGIQLLNYLVNYPLYCLMLHIAMSSITCNLSKQNVCAVHMIVYAFLYVFVCMHRVGKVTSRK